MTEQHIITAEAVIEAPAATIFELIANPSRQPEWDGNDNLVAAEGQERVRQEGDVFAMEIHNGTVRDNLVTEFVEGERIAWAPATQGEAPAGHLWRWELEPVSGREREATLVRHTYDWTKLRDEQRMRRARATQAENLLASIRRLGALAEREAQAGR
ncbi:SRPBCC family protein [Leucobacter sp. UCMA 4100]|uniref:SRPBCC family protein n=1 Tax=Leucobacter sp. UCMA 4100 TaxID=2810534 RepID=UPI0022EB3D1F|nr:SRPBCC family protein [Leucobacter sp. UCMA 4100]MDA3147047.1 SRPBCC family protein [Leucobacter sp. UCMA 4100]